MHQYFANIHHSVCPGTLSIRCLSHPALLYVSVSVRCLRYPVFMNYFVALSTLSLSIGSVAQVTCFIHQSVSSVAQSLSSSAFPQIHCL